MLRPCPLELDAHSRALYARFVPHDHPLRRLDDAVDFSFVLPLVADRYCRGYGRPAQHPERMWRLLFAEYYLNLSDERVCLAAHESLALRWFLRLNASEQPPHPTTLQKFRSDRLDEGVYVRVHCRPLGQPAAHGLLDRTRVSPTCLAWRTSGLPLHHLVAVLWVMLGLLSQTACGAH